MDVLIHRNKAVRMPSKQFSHFVLRLQNQCPMDETEHSSIAVNATDMKILQDFRNA